MSRVSINIVSWNSRKYLPEALASIAAQTFRDFSVLVVDNASVDGSAEYLRSEHPGVALLRNTRNLGFAKAHNQGIAYARAHLDRSNGGAYVLVTNPDIILDPDCLERLIDGIDRRPEVGSAAPKLLKVYPSDGEFGEPRRSDRIDSLGIKLFRSRRAVDRSAGRTDDGSFDRTEEIFGPSGALAFYRLSALEDVAPDGEYFDEDLFAYKEDIDLAWRLRRRGWNSLYLPAARAYHYRAAYCDERASVWKIARERRGRSRFVSFLSYRNHRLLLAKNDRCLDRLIHWPWIAWYELKKTVYLLFFEPGTLFRGGLDYWRLCGRIRAKRREIMKRAKVAAKDLRRWFQ